MKNIGYLIPEFPGQTHAFFIRERDEIVKRGLQPLIISTRKPIDGAGLAKHDWAEREGAKTTYLFPMGLVEFIAAKWEILKSGPTAWVKCLGLIFSAKELSFKDKLKMPLFWLAAGKLKTLSKKLDFDHIHVHSCANSAHVAMFAKVMGGPDYSLTLHGPMDDYGKNQAQKWQFAKFCVIITHELVAEVKERLSDIQLPDLYLAPMGVNVENFKRRTAYQAPHVGEPIKLVSCGRLNGVKAHDDLVRVVGLLKDRGIEADLHVCGTVDAISDKGGYLNQLNELVASLGLESQVSFLGSVSEERIRQELEACDFFCLASLKEPLGVAIMEAMAMEVPSIVTRSPGTEELIESGENGMLVSARSPEEFADVIKSLIGDAELCEAFAIKGREKIVQGFHSGVSAEKIVEGVLS